MKEKIELKGVKVHNLKNVNLSLEKGKLILFTGVSGSGKSSLAFDTIFVEGQRRYIESLSHHARRYLGDLTKPDLEKAEGISPTIAIEQKLSGRSPRSTVGTLTGIYDFLRVLFARIGEPHCPISKEPLSAQSRDKILKKLELLPQERRIMVLAPYAKGKKGEFKEEFKELLQKGFTRLRVDQEILEITGDERLDGKKAHDVDIVIDRIKVSEDFSRLKEAASLALELGKGFFTIVDIDQNEEISFSEFAYSKKSGLSYSALDPSDFSFNHPKGMCEECHGLGVSYEFDLDKIIDEELSIKEDCFLIGSSYQTIRYGNIFDNLARIYKFSVKTPWKKLSKEAKDVLLYGTEKKWTKMRFKHPDKSQKWTEFVRWQGILFEAKKRMNEAKSDRYKEKMTDLMSLDTCPACQGSRLKPYPRECLIGNQRIHELIEMPLEDLHAFFEKLTLSSEDAFIAAELLKEIRKRIQFLLSVGLSYLTLNRSSPTLSGGEAQRVRLASQVGSSLVGAIYVLDEPSIGLHPEDHEKLIQTLKDLRDLGNTVIVVEHDEDTIRAADLIVDVGIGAGKEGGEILSSGSYEDLLKAKNSLTKEYLTKERVIPVPKKRRKLKNGIQILGANHHNLQNIDVEIPLGGLVCVTGLSGSGKSSLISDILYPALTNHFHHGEMKVGKHKKITGIDKIDKVIAIDQSPIGRTPRSNAATYTKLFDHIRDLYASLPESKARGYQKGHFSFNVKEGSCPSCEGAGVIKIDMDYLEDVFTTCKECQGKRFESDILSITFNGKNIFEVLEMDCDSALIHFENQPAIFKKLQLLQKVGLGYLSIGQPSPTLSGGEAQRIKLAKELVRPEKGHTLYILDEPTTGLHFHDLSKLIKLLHELIDRGNSMVVIEHNLELIKTADFIIELGPKAGSGGGKVVAATTPEKLLKMDTATARALQALGKPPKKRAEEVQRESRVKKISIEKAEENNLRGISLEINHGEITLFTGPSGSGKTSLAFDTIYAEGQRRYIESLSSYAKSFVSMPPKPKVERIDGLSPAIAIEQVRSAVNPRSTVGTMTEIYDLLRILYAHLGIAYSPETGNKIESISKEFVAEKLLSIPPKQKIHILAPVKALKPGSFPDFIARLEKEGYLRIRLNNHYYEIDEEIPYQERKKNELFIVVDRVISGSISEKRAFEAISKAADLGEGMLTIATPDEDLFFNLAFSDPATGKSYSKLTPQTFSFNHESGMCPDCSGIGIAYGLNIFESESLMKLSIKGIMRIILKSGANRHAMDLIEDLFDSLKIDTNTPLQKLSPKELKIFIDGEETPRENNTFIWRGFSQTLEEAARSIDKSIRFFLLPLMKERKCPTCNGTRLNEFSRHVRIDDLSLPDFCDLPIKNAKAFIDSLKPSIIPFLEESYEEIKKQLSFLEEIGLSYLSLARSAPTLSGGELQRIRLARQLGSSLTSCIYVLDEPSVGLHPHNNHLLNQALLKLKKLGNTLVIVEHDPMTIKIADRIIDFGPGAGSKGGKITADGSYNEILTNPDSLTGAYLSQRKTISTPHTRRKGGDTLKIRGAKVHNLKNLDVDLPSKTLTCITGVSGSGKSSLLHYVVTPAIKEHLRTHKKVIQKNEYKVTNLDLFDKLIVIDQNVIKVSPRSDVASYSDSLAPLRFFYASLKKAKASGLTPTHFSYHHKKGMCKTCWGLGYKSIDLQFMPAVKVKCETCSGFKLNQKTLEVTYREKHLGEILQMTVEEAKEHFSEIASITRKLNLLIRVGLGYLHLGQAILSLSGGEAQRIRLSKELSKRSTGKTLYIIDEPTTGLHPDDIQKLLLIFHELVDKKNTIFLIEHNLDCIKNADYVVDIGPNAGDEGGKLIATGTPEEIIKNKASFTGQYLKELL